ncbi:uncharacterized protein LOC113329796 [Papaver somniferum]|uniref:uncharacterized protein LOC113329796 n=1 Tax=Papaver somniferum TaxID=3469 RepID=UPI000E6F97DF|nr:uncharacterized protein LOC113329796 [Papaver somniferum]
MEESLSLFMQATQKSITNLEQTTSRSITSLERQIGQLASQVNERDKGQFPSQTMPNHKGSFEVSTSGAKSSDQLQSVSSLRSGWIIDNHVGNPKENEHARSTPIVTQVTPSTQKETNESGNTYVPRAPFPQRKRHPKYKDPGCPTIACTIVEHKIEHVLLDLGASVNLFPYYVYEQLRLGDLKPTNVTLQLADRSTKIPRGVVEDILVSVDIFVYPVDFIILDTQPVNHLEDPLESCLTHFRQDTTDDSVIYEVNALLDSTPLLDTSKWKPRIEPPVLFESRLVPSVEKALTLTLNPLSDTLKYVYLGFENTLPIIISYNLTLEQESRLVDVLREHKTAIGWSIADLKERFIEVFMDNFSVFGSSFDEYLHHLTLVLMRCKEKNLVWNWENSNFMVQSGIVLGHIVSFMGIEVDRDKVDLISKLRPLRKVTEVRSFLGHAGFYRRFIKDFSKISRPLCNLLGKDVAFVCDETFVVAFEKLKLLLTFAPIIQPPNWNLPFEIMCDAFNFAVGAALGQRKDKAHHVIYYASKTLNDAQLNYTTTEKELLSIVFAVEKFRPYLLGSKIIIFSDHAALKYLISKKDAKPKLITWILFLQGFNFDIQENKGSKNVVADHLSRIVSQSSNDALPFHESFLDEQLFVVSQLP